MFRTQKEVRDLSLEEQVKAGEWVYDHYDMADTLSSDTIYPVCIPSYKRHDGSAKSVHLACESGEVNVYLFIYEEEFADYNFSYGIYDNLTIVICPEGVRGIGAKRQYILEYMSEVGFNKIIMMDDDISKLKFGIPAETLTSGNYTTLRRATSFDKYTKLWMEYIRRYEESPHLFEDGTPMRWGMSGTVHDLEASRSELPRGDEFIINANPKSTFAFVAINLEEFNKHSIRYHEVLKEDIDIMIQCWDAGLTTIRSSNLSYVTPEMANGKSVVGDGDYGTKSRIMVEATMDKWGDEFLKVKEAHGLTHCQIKWNVIKKRFFKHKRITEVK